jgi:hypothetical protein
MLFAALWPNGGCTEKNLRASLCTEHEATLMRKSKAPHDRHRSFGDQKMRQRLNRMALAIVCKTYPLDKGSADTFLRHSRLKKI